LANAGNPTSGVIGELWVEYEIEAFVPRVNNTPQFQNLLVTANVVSGTNTLTNFLQSNPPISYGPKYIDVLAPGNVFRVNVGGYYIIHWRYQASTAFSSGGNAPMSFANCTTWNLPTQMTGNSGLVGTPAMWNNPIATQFGFVGGPVCVSNFLYMDCQTQFTPPSSSNLSPTNFTIDQTFLTSSTAVFSFEMCIQRVPYLTNSNVPVLPEITLMNDKFAIQEEKLRQLEQRVLQLNDWDDVPCDNNNTLTAKPLADTSRVDELVRQVFDTSNKYLIRDSKKSVSNK